MDIKKQAMKYALQNAVKFEGKVNPGAVIGKLIAEDPKLKSDMKTVSAAVKDAIKDISAMSAEQQLEKLSQLAPELLKALAQKHGEEKKELKELKISGSGNVIMRFEPSPSGPLHIGHAYVGGLNRAYTDKYSGKMIVRISDTNSKNIYEPAYDLIPEDAKWLWGDVEIAVQSERLELYYEYALKLLEQGDAYVCTCSGDDFRNYSKKKTECSCRNSSSDENIKKWNSMLNEMEEGDAVVRFKTSMQDKNPAMRDFPILRINTEPHSKTGTKYKVWPLMNFSVAIDDLDMGVTHTLRGKDHMDNAKKQGMIFKALKADIPENIFVGRINFTGLPVSCSETRPRVASGEFTGWDDIRLPFIPALKRRGYQSKAFIAYAKAVGVTQTDKTVSKDEFFKMLNAFNKDIIDPISNRYFFVQEPVEVIIEGAPEQKIELNLHPDSRKKGRNFSVHNAFYIEKNDFESIKDKELVRLMDCLNFVKEKDSLRFVSVEYEEFKEKGKKIIHWLPKDSKQIVSATLLMDNNELVNGFIERTAESLENGDICQLERHGFCRLDSKNIKQLEFWFCHR